MIPIGIAEVKNTKIIILINNGKIEYDEFNEKTRNYEIGTNINENNKCDVLRKNNLLGEIEKVLTSLSAIEYKKDKLVIVLIDRIIFIDKNYIKFETGGMSFEFDIADYFFINSSWSRKELRVINTKKIFGVIKYSKKILLSLIILDDGDEI